MGVRLARGDGTSSSKTCAGTEVQSYETGRCPGGTTWLASPASLATTCSRRAYRALFAAVGGSGFQAPWTSVMRSWPSHVRDHQA